MPAKVQRRDPILRVIAVFKLIKSTLCICAGIGVLHFLNRDVESYLEHVINNLHVDVDNHLVRQGLEAAGKVTNTKIAAASAIAFFYALLFGIEGTGLYLRKRWAEWFVVVITSTLLPLEIYEIIHKVSALKIAVTIGNLLIIAYLVIVIRRKQE